MVVTRTSERSTATYRDSARARDNSRGPELQLVWRDRTDGAGATLVVGLLASACGALACFKEGAPLVGGAFVVLCTFVLCLMLAYRVNTLRLSVDATRVVVRPTPLPMLRRRISVSLSEIERISVSGYVKWSYATADRDVVDARFSLTAVGTDGKLRHVATIYDIQTAVYVWEQVCATIGTDEQGILVRDEPVLTRVDPGPGERS